MKGFGGGFGDAAAALGLAGGGGAAAFGAGAGADAGAGRPISLARSIAVSNSLSASTLIIRVGGTKAAMTSRSNPRRRASALTLSIAACRSTAVRSAAAYATDASSEEAVPRTQSAPPSPLGFGPKLLQFAQQQRLGRVATLQCQPAPIGRGVKRGDPCVGLIDQEQLVALAHGAGDGLARLGALICEARQRRQTQISPDSFHAPQQRGRQAPGCARDPRTRRLSSAGAPAAIGM